MNEGGSTRELCQVREDVCKLGVAVCVIFGEKPHLDLITYYLGAGLSDRSVFFSLVNKIKCKRKKRTIPIDIEFASV